MDRRLLSLQRSYAARPDEPAALERLVAELARRGRLYDARKLVQRRLATRAFERSDLRLLVRLGREAGFIDATPLQRSPVLSLSALVPARRGPADVEVEIGFAGVEGCGALVAVVALAEAFGQPLSGLLGSGLYRPDGPRARLELDKPGETSFEFSLELREPWTLSRRCRLRRVRVTTIPTARHKVTLRRRVLRTVNALALVVDGRSDGSGETNEDVARRLQRDLAELWTTPLERFPTALVYCEPTRPELHKALLIALGLRRAPRIQAHIETSAPIAARPRPAFAHFRAGRDEVLAHEGILDAFALLLLHISDELGRL